MTPDPAWRLRKLFVEIAPPVDVERIIRTTAVPRRSWRGAAIAIGTAAVVLVLGLGSYALLGQTDQPPTDQQPATVTSSTAPTTTSVPAESIVTTTTHGLPPIEELRPLRVKCSTELEAFPCAALIDGDPNTRWNATDGGVGAEITLIFDPPVQVVDVFFYNVAEEEAYLRNARIRQVEIEVDDLPQSINAELADTQEPQRVQLRSLNTSVVTFRVVSAHPAQSFGDREPFRELALEGIVVFGRDAPILAD